MQLEAVLRKLQIDLATVSEEWDSGPVVLGENRGMKVEIVKGRDGAWRFSDDNCRAGYRYNENPGYADVCFGYDIYGFRCVRNASAPVAK
jgi:formylglycine-generating enzyme required for sulfatase activity